MRQGDCGKSLEGMKRDNGKPLEGKKQEKDGTLLGGMKRGIITLAAMRRIDCERRWATK